MNYSRPREPAFHFLCPTKVPQITYGDLFFKSPSLLFLIEWDFAEIPIRFCGTKVPQISHSWFHISEFNLSHKINEVPQNFHVKIGDLEYEQQENR